MWQLMPPFFKGFDSGLVVLALAGLEALVSDGGARLCQEPWDFDFPSCLRLVLGAHSRAWLPGREDASPCVRRETPIQQAV